jgi:hypothetical protein
VLLVEQQQQQQSRQDAAASNIVQPSNVIMGLWAAATVGVTVPKRVRLSKVFDYLTQPQVVQELTGGSSSRLGVQARTETEEAAASEVVRSCGTVLWVAAQLGFAGDLDVLKPYAAACVDSPHAACSSLLTVVMSLATLLQRQQQGGVRAGDVVFWQSSFLQCSQSAVASLQQQRQGRQHAAAVAAQLLWEYDVAGLSPPQDQLQALLDATGDQVRCCQAQGGKLHSCAPWCRHTCLCCVSWSRQLVSACRCWLLHAGVTAVVACVCL